MKIALVRTGVSPTARTSDIAAWRTWAYGAAIDHGAPALTAPVLVRVTTNCQDHRGVTTAPTAWPVVQAVLEGAVAAGLMQMADVLEVTLVRPQVTGRSELRVEMKDALEPF